MKFRENCCYLEKGPTAEANALKTTPPTKQAHPLSDLTRSSNATYKTHPYIYPTLQWKKLKPK